MTDREAMKMALEALKNTATRSAAEQYATEQNVIEALEAALAQPDETETLKRCLFQMQEAAKALAQPEQEPIAWRKKMSGVWHYFDESTPFPFDDCEPLYEKN